MTIKKINFQCNVVVNLPQNQRQVIYWNCKETWALQRQFIHAYFSLFFQCIVWPHVKHFRKSWCRICQQIKMYDPKITISNNRLLIRVSEETVITCRLTVSLVVAHWYGFSAIWSDLYLKEKEKCVVPYKACLLTKESCVESISGVSESTVAVFRKRPVYRQLLIMQVMHWKTMKISVLICNIWIWNGHHL